MKKCTKCGEYKSLDSYGPHKKTIDKLNSWCKYCCSESRRIYNKTKEGIIKNIYSNQVSRSRSRGHTLPSYTKEEFYKFAYNSIEFNNLYNKWVESNYNKLTIPSFDRDNDKLPYSFKNFNKWMTWEDNKKKGSRDIRSGKLKHGNKPQIEVVGRNIKTLKLEVYPSLSEAERITGAKKSNIHKCCNGKRRIAGDREWSYLIEKNKINYDRNI